MIHFSKPPVQAVQWIAPIKQALQKQGLHVLKICRQGVGDSITL
jgi:hypothetical protein